MTPDEKLAALGLADVDLITRAEFDALPEHRRLCLGPLPVSRHYAYLRLPDPPPVAALRRAFRVLNTPGMSEQRAVDEVANILGAALAEFDGTTT